MDSSRVRHSLLKFRHTSAIIAAGMIAGALGLASSTAATVSTGVRTTYVPISPCRLMDTRPGSANIGPRSTPLTAGETYTASARGTNGMCNIPDGAVAVAMNVTVVNPTSASFLTVFPSDAAQPLASSLNWVAGQAPTPNAVTTPLSVAAGKVSLFNNAGSVDVIADVVGYFEDHNFDDRYYTKAQVDAGFYSKAQVDAGYYTKAQVDAKVSPEVILPPGVNVPNPLVPSVVFTQIDETLTSMTRGHWLATKSLFGGSNCSGSSQSYYFLILDGVPIRSSAILKFATVPNQAIDTLIGVTPDVVPAGSHKLGAGAECAAGTLSGSGIQTSSVSSAIVLP